MKGEYVEEKDHTNTMFAKLHQTQKFQPHHHHHHQPPPQPYPTSTHHHNFQLASTGECPTSEEADSPSQTTSTKKELTTTDGGETIEVVRRPRGRPPGSKNKPKPPVIITRDSEPSMSQYILEVPAGSDIINSISLFCRRRHSGLCILNGSGVVANVTLKQPSTTPGATVTFHGRFDILSISGTILPSFQHSQIGNNFTISLAGPQGQIVGGAVVGQLFAATTVYVIAASFNNPLYHRLPAEDETRNEGNNGCGNEGRSPSGVSGGGDTPSAGGEGCGMSIYSGNLPTDVVWAPTARQPPPPAPY